ncbi:hypothetical protein STEG23_013105 [Scotinomys teguina]
MEECYLLTVHPAFFSNLDQLLTGGTMHSGLSPPTSNHQSRKYPAELSTGINFSIAVRRHHDQGELQKEEFTGVYSFREKAQEENKKIVLAGCVPQAQPRQDYLKGLSIIGVQQIDRVVEVVEETIKDSPCEEATASVELILFFNAQVENIGREDHSFIVDI